MTDDHPLAHIHGQFAWHDPVTVFANLPALEAMKAAIDQAIAAGPGGKGTALLFPTDGEGFELSVKILPGGDPRWDDVPLPYTADYARNDRPPRLTPGS